jgi:molybdopterin-containing oxidoreductase family membrane subunit
MSMDSSSAVVVPVASAKAEHRQHSSALRIWVTLLLVLMAAGFATWVYQLIRGLQITDMRDNVIWGLYIISFMFCVGLSAGGLIVASAGRIFGVARFQPIVRLAVVEATVMILIASLFIIIDIGRPDRILNLFIHAHWLSPMVWDVTVVLIYLLLSLTYVWLYTRRDLAARGSWLALGTKDSSAGAREEDHRITYRLAWVALPTAILLHSITGWIFGLQISRGFWYTSLMAPMFIASALASGLALVIVLAIIMRHYRRVAFDDGLLSYLGGILAVFVAVQAFFVFAEVLTAAFPGAAGNPSRLLLSGRYAPGFIGVEVILGLVIPFALMASAKGRQRTSLVALASVLTIIGIFAHRGNIIVIALSHAPMQLAPGTPLGTPAASGSSFATSSVYFPTIYEFLIAIGVFSFAALLFTLAAHYLPLKERAES